MSLKKEKLTAAELSILLPEFAPELLRYFRRRSSNTDDAADLLAECYLVAWRRRADIPADFQEARMWLYGVASKLLNNAARAKHRQAALAERLRSTFVAYAPPAEIPEVAEAINRLPADQRELIRLVHWDDFTVVEAASILGLSESTARGRYQRARVRLAADPDVQELRSALEPNDAT